MTIAEILHLLVSVVGGEISKISEDELPKLHAAIRKLYGEAEPAPPPLSAEDVAKYEAYKAYEAQQAAAGPQVQF